MENAKSNWKLAEKKQTLQTTKYNESVHHKPNPIQYEMI